MAYPTINIQERAVLLRCTTDHFIVTAARQFNGRRETAHPPKGGCIRWFIPSGGVRERRYQEPPASRQKFQEDE